MAIINKRATGRLAANTLIYSGECWYYGFTCLPGGADRTIVIYNATSATGTRVEDAIADGTKTFDGHSHAIPVHCATGLYITLAGCTCNVFWKPAKQA